MRQIIIIAFLISMAFNCNSQPREIVEETIYESRSPELKNLLKRYNTISNDIQEIYRADTTRIELYLQIKENGIISRVKNFYNLDDDKEFYASYNIIKSKAGFIIFIGMYPNSGSGDWDLNYENYFDENGNLVAFIRNCSFFNSECAQVVHEKSEYFYNSKHELVKKTYVITDENNKPLDYKKCIFYYRFDYKQYMTLKEYLLKFRFSRNGV